MRVVPGTLIAVHRALGMMGMLSVVALAAPGVAQPPPLLVFEVTTEVGPVRAMIAEGVPLSPGPGRYFALDRRGLRCEVRVVRTRELTSSMLVSGRPPHQVELAVVGDAPCWTEGPGGEHVVVVGPLAAPPARARLMALGLARAGSSPGAIPREAPGVPLPEDRADDQIGFAVDLDGDRTADVVTTADRRSLPASGRGTFRVEHRQRTWTRAGRTWTSAAGTAWTIEAPIH